MNNYNLNINSFEIINNELLSIEEVLKKSRMAIQGSTSQCNAKTKSEMDEKVVNVVNEIGLHLKKIECEMMNVKQISSKKCTILLSSFDRTRNIYMSFKKSLESCRNEKLENIARKECENRVENLVKEAARLQHLTYENEEVASHYLNEEEIDRIANAFLERKCKLAKTNAILKNNSLEWLKKRIGKEIEGKKIKVTPDIMHILINMVLDNYSSKREDLKNHMIKSKFIPNEFQEKLQNRVGNIVKLISILLENPKNKTVVLEENEQLYSYKVSVDENNVPNQEDVIMILLKIEEMVNLITHDMQDCNLIDKNQQKFIQNIKNQLVNLLSEVELAYEKNKSILPQIKLLKKQVSKFDEKLQSMQSQLPSIIPIERLQELLIESAEEMIRNNLNELITNGKFKPFKEIYVLNDIKNKLHKEIESKNHHLSVKEKESFDKQFSESKKYIMKFLDEYFFNELNSEYIKLINKGNQNNNNPSKKERKVQFKQENNVISNDEKKDVKLKKQIQWNQIFDDNFNFTKSQMIDFLCDQLKNELKLKSYSPEFIFLKSAIRLAIENFGKIDDNNYRDKKTLFNMLINSIRFQNSYEINVDKIDLDILRDLKIHDSLLNDIDQHKKKQQKYFNQFELRLIEENLHKIFEYDTNNAFKDEFLSIFSPKYPQFDKEQVSNLLAVLCNSKNPIRVFNAQNEILGILKSLKETMNNLPISTIANSDEEEEKVRETLSNYRSDDNLRKIFELHKEHPQQIKENIRKKNQSRKNREGTAVQEMRKKEMEKVDTFLALFSDSTVNLMQKLQSPSLVYMDKAFQRVFP